MIRHLKGRLADRGKGYVVIDVGGVGFHVLTPDPAPGGGEGGATGPGEWPLVSLHTRLQVREDALTLYGFSSTEEAGLFDLLLTVSGVGPKLALGIISTCRPKRFLELVLFQDTDGLSRLPGVGKKLSQRLVVELRDKLGPPREAYTAAELAAQTGSSDPVEEAIEALAALGYGRVEAAAAIDKACKELGDKAEVTELIRRGLKGL